MQITPKKEKDASVKKQVPTINLSERNIEYNVKLELGLRSIKLYDKYTSHISYILSLFRNAHRLFFFDNKYVFKDDFDLVYACIYGKKVPSGYLKAKKIVEYLAKQKDWTKELTGTDTVTQLILQNWSPGKIESNTSSFKHVVDNRNALIKSTSEKIHCVTDLLDKYKCTTLCINDTIDFTNRVAKDLNDTNRTSDQFALFHDRVFPISMEYHNKVESRYVIDPETGLHFEYATGKRKGQWRMFGADLLNRMTKSSMTNGGEIKVYSIPKKLEERLYIKDLQLIISTYGGIEPRHYLDNEEVPIIINLYYDDFTIGNTMIDSKDKKQLIARQRSSNTTVYWIDSISQILYYD